MTGHVAAVDLGATSGRVVIGHVSSSALQMRTVARFDNTPVRNREGLYWDILALYRGATAGLAQAFRDEPGISSIGVDSWAVDYGLFAGGKLLSNPHHYRDERNGSGVDSVHRQISQAELYRHNGLQFLPFNTMYQLTAEKIDGLFDLADTALLIPDVVTYWLTGEQRTEITNASTTGLLNSTTGDWDPLLCETLGIPSSLWAPLISPGEHIGVVSPGVASGLGITHVPVTAVGSHDTASAVVAVPLHSQKSAYISCGTWGLVGLELSAPILSDAAREANFTNELGVDGRTRFLHNVMGLWILSEAVRTWNAMGVEIDLPTLLDEAAEVRGEVAIFDVNDPRFLAPGDMPSRIAQWCTEYGQPTPHSKAEFTRSILESLAEAFAHAVRTAGELSGTEVDVIHMVGGGALNHLLCQRLADRSGKVVLAGPVEATALGNLLIQARAQGFVSGDLESLRSLVKRAEQPIRFTPTTHHL